MNRTRPLSVRFFCTATGREPVREWLRGLARESKKVIGEDIKTVQLGWPIGMPVVRKLDRDLWEVRSTLSNSIARVMFTVHEGMVVLLHGFIKKSQQTPKRDLNLSLDRMQTLQSEQEP